MKEDKAQLAKGQPRAPPARKMAARFFCCVLRFLCLFLFVLVWLCVFCCCVLVFVVVWFVVVCVCVFLCVVFVVVVVWFG